MADQPNRFPRTLLGAAVGGVVGFLLGTWFSTFFIDDTPAAKKGQPFVLAGPTLAGPKIDVADYRGKVVLVDFWATWCGPCLQELPHVQAAYDKHHADGFEVVAVSLDDDRELLAEFVKAHKLPWPQIFYPEQHGRGGSPLATAHGITGIPATFLLDAEGKVDQTNLRGERLEKEVARLLNKPGGAKTQDPTDVYTYWLCAGWFAVVFAVVGAYLCHPGAPPPARQVRTR